LHYSQINIVVFEKALKIRRDEHEVNTTESQLGNAEKCVDHYSTKKKIQLKDGQKIVALQVGKRNLVY